MEKEIKKEEQDRKKHENNADIVVGIGASAGGLDAIKKLFENLPQNTELTFIVIQHLDPNQESMLPEILTRYTKIPIERIRDGLQIQPNRIYTVPAGKTITLTKNTLKVQAKATARKPIDAFLTSLAQEKKTHAIGIILSGTGTDGTEGLKAVKAQGGITFAQDPKTAQYQDMPKAAISAQTTDYTLSPQDIAKKLVEIANHPKIARKEIQTQDQQQKEEDGTKKILTLLKSAFDVNFANYKKTTINRRINRRMILNNIENTEKYLQFLKNRQNELEALFDDLLINVTKFFREPETFKILKETVFPLIEQQKKTPKNIRIWVPGCSTGEEVYSLAITLQEFLEEKNILDWQIQIFGTDINNKNIEKARVGIYPKTAEENISEKRLKRFFHKSNGNYQIKKTIRDLCIFAKHDLTKDPPFSNLDLILCRNLLIYLDNFVQQRIIPTFHYALKNGGYLVLGQSESVGNYVHLFESVKSKGAVFRKKLASSNVEFTQIIPSNSAKKTTENELPIKADFGELIEKEADRLLLSSYVPASMVLNSNFDVVVFHGKVDPYISIPSGKANFNVTNIVKPQLKPSIQTALFRASKDKEPINETIRIKEDSQTRMVQIQVKPIKTPRYEDYFFLVFFEEISKTKPVDKSTQPSFSKENQKAQEQQIKELSEDLASTKIALKTVIEQNEATNEELRSALEEAQSGNEELMSTNEELETTKEELQSTNEELKTLNDELRDRNQHLDLLNDDLSNLMNNLDTAVVIIDDNFKIRRFTHSAKNLLRLTPLDINMPINDIRLGIPIDNLKELLSKATENLETIREEVRAGKDRWYQLRVRPFLSHDKKVKGAVLSLAEISEMKRLEDENASYTADLEQRVNEQAGELLASERLSSIGKTAGMVGHDIRNPLQSIVSELYVARQEMEEVPPGEMKENMLESIGCIEEQIFYINKIVSDLQDYARPAKPQFLEVDIQGTIDLVLSRIPISDSVRVCVDVESGLSKPFLDGSFLQRILTNLISNAVQAMPKGGDLVVSAGRLDGSLIFKVADSGEGISKETKEKLFTPLFTTKSKGQGFGLAVVKRLTEAMGGEVSFESEVGKGTTFTIKFPKHTDI